MLVARDQLARRGLTVGIVSTAGTGTCAFAAELPEVTELQAGSYPFMDSDYARVEGLPYESSLTVIASVVSRQRDRHRGDRRRVEGAEHRRGPPGL